MTVISHRWVVAGLAALSLASCQTDPSSTERSDATIGADHRDPATSSAPTADPASDVTAPLTVPDVAEPAPASTAATASSAPSSPSLDGATGLRHTAASTPPPADAVVDDPIADQATIIIAAGPQSYSGSGGSCSVIDGFTFVFVGDPAGANASLSWNTEHPAEGQFLGWRYGDSSDTSLISTHGIDRNDAIQITFGEAGTSGSFTGWYFVVASQTFSQFTGSFSCLPAPMFIAGDHPLSLIEARCTTDGISAGGAGVSDAALLSLDPDVPEAGGLLEGALTWRVDGVVYETEWLLVRPTADGVGGSFLGEAVDRDGSRFELSGSFNCLTS
jgi:hypothetical protein